MGLSASSPTFFLWRGAPQSRSARLHRARPRPAVGASTCALRARPCCRALRRAAVYLGDMLEEITFRRYPRQDRRTLALLFAFAEAFATVSDCLVSPEVLLEGAARRPTVGVRRREDSLERRVCDERRAPRYRSRRSSTSCERRADNAVTPQQPQIEPQMNAEPGYRGVADRSCASGDPHRDEPGQPELQLPFETPSGRHEKRS